MKKFKIMLICAVLLLCAVAATACGSNNEYTVEYKFWVDGENALTVDNPYVPNFRSTSTITNDGANTTSFEEGSVIPVFFGTDWGYYIDSVKINGEQWVTDIPFEDSAAITLPNTFVVEENTVVDVYLAKKDIKIMFLDEVGEGNTLGNINSNDIIGEKTIKFGEKFGVMLEPPQSSIGFSNTLKAWNLSFQVVDKDTVVDNAFIVRYFSYPSDKARHEYSFYLAYTVKTRGTSEIAFSNLGNREYTAQMRDGFDLIIEFEDEQGGEAISFMQAPFYVSVLTAEAWAAGTKISQAAMGGYEDFSETKTFTTANGFTIHYYSVILDGRFTIDSYVDTNYYAFMLHYEGYDEESFLEMAEYLEIPSV